MAHGIERTRVADAMTYGMSRSFYSSDADA